MCVCMCVYLCVCIYVCVWVYKDFNTTISR